MKSMSPLSVKRLRRRVFGQLWQLALQLVLGMAVNLIGPESHGPARVVMVIILLLHILNGIGLFEGNLYIALHERNALSWRAFAATTLALVAGVLTVALKSTTDIWSFVMALAFVASAGLNGMLYIQADRRIHQDKVR